MAMLHYYFMLGVVCLYYNRSLFVSASGTPCYLCHKLVAALKCSKIGVAQHTVGIEYPYNFHVVKVEPSYNFV